MVTNQSEIAEQAIDAAQSEIDTLAHTQTEVDTQIEIENTESIVSEDNTQTAAAETDVDQAVEEVVTIENVAEVNVQETSNDTTSLDQLATDATAENTTQTSEVTLLNATPETAENPVPAIAEDTIRVHFQEVTDDDFSQYSLWTWGAVAEPSDGNNWPAAATAFSYRTSVSFNIMIFYALSILNFFNYEIVFVSIFLYLFKTSKINII